MSEKVQQLLGRMHNELADTKPSSIRAFDQEASAIPGVIKLTLGEPDFNTPEHIKQAAIKSIENNHSHYPQSAGTPGLRAAAANFLDKKYNLNYTADNILVTVGATEAIATAVMAVTNPGDEIIVPTPIWPMYISILKAHGVVPVFINTAEEDFVLSPEKLKATLDEHGDKVKAVVLNFPSNPTGVTYRRADTKAIADVLADRDVFVIADEIYSELTYGEKHVSVAEYLPEQTILINGVSKSHAMTGWRIGIIAAQADIQKELFKMHQFTVTTATYNAQDAAEEAFTNGFEDGLEMCKDYQKRGEFVYEQMTSFGFTATKPQGAFYSFCKIPESWNIGDWDFCRQLLAEQKVAVVAGSPFGPGGEGYIRISYASSMENLQEAMVRIGKFVDAHFKTAANA
ncbi:aminotransferase class I/II-fold pyridoxal phosphate-dependent enzyme [Paucilactobacillus nenjiangensis]|jgi:aminotransferase|uniref:aminotransferase class I/II-fold pyridoxal phosphate-dependent enzyme n=1 Tax=Paucilactobacillus nenjiangensis TaxID=1296540 RepID=UPI0010F4B357|nr:aminotransferase class I/II-fold pyridoxal phosphate-dependent enzyme [Paucilactobacillus nenjiangensis]